MIEDLTAEQLISERLTIIEELDGELEAVKIERLAHEVVILRHKIKQCNAILAERQQEALQA